MNSAQKENNMLYKLLLLPTHEQIFTDGCTLIAFNGNKYTFNASAHPNELYWYKNECKVAEPWIVSVEFNEIVKIGRPSPESLKWLKVGMEIKAVDCEVTEDVVHVTCPTCREKH